MHGIGLVDGVGQKYPLGQTWTLALHAAIDEEPAGLFVLIGHEIHLALYAYVFVGHILIIVSSLVKPHPGIFGFQTVNGYTAYDVGFKSELYTSSGYVSVFKAQFEFNKNQFTAYDTHILCHSVIELIVET